MAASDKFCSLAGIEERLRKVRASGQKVVQCHGVFDVLHPGHILHFKEARTFGDYLVVTVTPDRFVNKGPGRPVFNERLRMETLAALESVDCVVLNEWPTAVEAIGAVRPDIYAKGKDYADPTADVTRKILDEEAAVRQAGGHVRFTTTEIYSSSSLANRFFSAYPPKTQEYLAAFKKRHPADEVVAALEKLSDVRVLVVGESILDQYTYCLPLAKSPKEFIVASRFQSDESFAGGTLATANHLAGLCKQVTLVTALGSERDPFDFIRSKMRPNVDLRAIRTHPRSTIIKRRFLEPSFLTKLFELQYLDDSPYTAEETAKVSQALEKALPEHDLVVVDDFGHGMLSDSVREQLVKSGKYLAVNTQTNSANLGFNPITRYRHADYACIDEAEVRMATGVKFESLRTVGARLRAELGARALMVTWGPRGAIMFDAEGSAHEAPALSVNVVDRIGAGDAFFAATAPCMYRGYPPEMVTFVGNCVGALKVAIVCNREPVDPVSLFKFIQHLLK
jgi:rfaE bifunctional protein nucleotidyltransferase chain/domain